MSITWLFLKAKNSALAAIPGRARAAPRSSPAFSACGRGIWLVPTCSGSFGAGSSRHQPRCLCWRQSRALNHAGDAPRLGFGWVLDSRQGRASDFHSAWVGCEQGLWHFGRLSPAATGDLGNLGRNIAISASVSQPHRPVAQGAAASCSLGVGRAAASRGFVLCCALKVMQSRSPRSIIYLWAKGEARGLLQLRALIHEEPAASLLLEKGATLGWEGKSCPPS